VLDQDHETLIRLRGGRFKSYLERFVPPVLFAGQHLRNVVGNLTTFLAGDFHMNAGMKHLIESFYRSIIHDHAAADPVPRVVLTARS